MSSQHRSISQRLERAKSTARKLQTLNEWVDDWADRNQGFYAATLRGQPLASEWNEDNAKRITALRGIFAKLLE